MENTKQKDAEILRKCIAEKIDAANYEQLRLLYIITSRLLREK